MAEEKKFPNVQSFDSKENAIAFIVQSQMNNPETYTTYAHDEKTDWWIVMEYKNEEQYLQSTKN